MIARRSLLAASATLGSLGVLAACGTDSGSDDATSGGSDAGGSDGTFPVEITTKFGPVTVDAAPTTVVALGWGDAEVCLSLGVQPVGASDWLGFGDAGVGPWATDLYDTAPTIIETMEPDFEAIANLMPDLILDVKSSGDQERYDRLTEIATTIGVPDGGDSYLTSAADQLTMIGTALGKASEAEALQTEVDDAFAAAAEAHPEWEGTSVTVATRTADGWGAYIDGDVRLGFLQKLGFVQSETIAGLPTGDSGFSVSIAADQLDLLESELVVAFPIYIETTELTEDKAWKDVKAVSEGRAVVVDGDLSSAFSLGTALATEYALDQLPKKIEDAIGG
jgi:iron complex transport system substrate-binding protein